MIKVDHKSLYKSNIMLQSFSQSEVNVSDHVHLALEGAI